MRILRVALALIALGVCVLAPATQVAAEVAIPELRAPLTDLTGSLSADQAAALEQKLLAFEQAKGSQISVLILPSTQPETIEQFGIRLADAWKLGRKGIDDGAILIVAKSDRRLRIEVGYGLEGALNDAVSNRIISETITPDFKQGRFYDGIDAGVDQMIGIVNGEELPRPSEHGQAGRQHGGQSPFGMLPFIFIGFYVVGHLLRWMMGSGVAAAAVGLGTGCVAMLLTASVVAAIFSGFIALLVALALYAARGVGGFGGGGFGGLGGGGFGGGGFGGGGGFSGGGGGFGGGGSSGSW